MEGLAPNLVVIQFIKMQLLNGVAMREIISLLAQRYEFDICRSLIEIKNRQHLAENSKAAKRNPIADSLIYLVQSALEGQSIYEELKNLEQECIWACDLEIENFYSKLPFYNLFPLLLCQFTSLLAVLILPILRQFTE